MIHYVITKGGSAVRWGTAQDEAQARLQAQAGESVHISAQPVPLRPSPAHQFDPDAWAWEDLRTAAERTEEEWQQVRIARERLLQQTDWTQLPDVPLATREKWQQYRQALRDITQQPDPHNIIWPQTPAEGSE